MKPIEQLEEKRAQLGISLKIKVILRNNYVQLGLTFALLFTWKERNRKVYILAGSTLSSESVQKASFFSFF